MSLRDTFFQIYDTVYEMLSTDESGVYIGGGERELREHAIESTVIAAIALGHWLTLDEWELGQGGQEQLISSRWPILLNHWVTHTTISLADRTGASVDIDHDEEAEVALATISRAYGRDTDNIRRLYRLFYQAEAPDTTIDPRNRAQAWRRVMDYVGPLGIFPTPESDRALLVKTTVDLADWLAAYDVTPAMLPLSIAVIGGNAYSDSLIDDHEHDWIEILFDRHPNDLGVRVEIRGELSTIVDRFVRLYRTLDSAYPGRAAALLVGAYIDNDPRALNDIERFFAAVEA